MNGMQQGEPAESPRASEADPQRCSRSVGGRLAVWPHGPLHSRSARFEVTFHASSMLVEEMQDMINNIAVVSDFANKQDNGNVQASERTAAASPDQLRP